MREYPECEVVTWLPVVEPDFGQERFMPDDPVKIIESRNFTLVPILIGRTTDEFVSPVLSKELQPIVQLNLSSTSSGSGERATEKIERQLPCDGSVLLLL